MPPRRIAPAGATLGLTVTMNPAIRHPNNRPARAARPVAQPGLDKAPVVPASPPATPQIEHIKKHASRFKCGGEIALALQIKSQLFNALRGVESNKKAAHLPFFHASTFAAHVTRDRRSKCATATLRLREFSDPENRPNSSCKFPQLVAIFPAASRRNTKNDFPRNSRSFPRGAGPIVPNPCVPAGLAATPRRMEPETDLETLLLGPVLADRACGDCGACCSVLTVHTPDFKKPAGTPCTHLTSRGCAIHAVRPHICRTWFCAWRRVADMPDEARPDRSGLLVSLNFERAPRNCFEGVSINVRTLAGGDAIDNGMAATILDSLSDKLIPIWFSDGSKKMLMHPENDVAQLVLSGEAAPAHLADEVAAWRERYGVFAANG